ncbi:hypothetical protein HanRHA438_Chr09g0395571 [Helianthus annuus]|nr:hypothetical protein HanRHA438_Chr09g0395571 [Helianthus annuus]
MRVKNHTLFFLLNLDLQWRREESGAVEMTGRGKNPLFPVTKVWRLHMPCPNQEVKTSLYRGIWASPNLNGPGPVRGYLYKPRPKVV